MKTLIAKSLILSIACGVLSMKAATAQDDQLIAAAIENPARAEDNVARDPMRKPAEVIKIMGVKPGSTVLDMVSNGGYYAEILAGVVGKDGRVIAQMFANSGMDPDNEYAAYIRNSAHMQNVVPIYANFNGLDLKENSLDHIFLIQNFHDFYFDRFNVDVEKILATFKKGLKPGGIVAIIDHDAGAGAPSSTGTSVHRIDAAIVKRDMAAAGFELVDESSILMNDTDDHSKSVFDDSVRGKTSRFILKFRNP